MQDLLKRETLRSLVGNALDRAVFQDPDPGDIVLCRVVGRGRFQPIGAALEAAFLDLARDAVVDALQAEELQRKVAGQPSLFEAA